ncbi:sorting nexin-3-like isoform X2 [Apodemus sylvaticus]|uniref:sorting nexin-3-like isoform X2 n=1 Tax=Apodemus sylvaticus TaxID=10129 RepID=UPI0022430C6E|nr:sorting nexin-3-like isoform X2 [Apodemus sylvaticus]
MAETVVDTWLLITKPQNRNDIYRPPSNFLKMDRSNQQTSGFGRGRFTTYEIRSKVVVSRSLGKHFLWQLPFRGDDGICDDNFIEERKQGLEQFINKVAGHPLAQNEHCLHMFLQDEIIEKSYTPSKIRHA